MKKRFAALIVIAFFTSYCNQQTSKYESQVATAQRFLKLARGKDTLAIRRMLEANLSDIGKNDHILAFEVSKIADAIKDKKADNVSSFMFKEYPAQSAELVTIYIPLFEKTSEESERQYLELFFTKFIKEGSIYNFRILNESEIPKR